MQSTAALQAFTVLAYVAWFGEMTTPAAKLLRVELAPVLAHAG